MGLGHLACHSLGRMVDLRGDGQQVSRAALVDRVVYFGTVIGGPVV